MSKFVPSHWFVVVTNPSCEDRARRSLSRAGFGVYVPTRQIERQHRRSKVWSTITRPHMPGYVFVDVPTVSAAEYWSVKDRPSWFRLRDCDGVKSVLGAIDGNGESVPVPIASRLVERLIAAQLNMEFDDTREAKIRREEIGRNERETSAMFFPVGSTVTVIDGPLTSFSGEVIGITSSGAVEALMEVFGRMTPVTLSARALEAA